MIETIADVRVRLSDGAFLECIPSRPAATVLGSDMEVDLKRNTCFCKLRCPGNKTV